MIKQHSCPYIVILYAADVQNINLNVEQWEYMVLLNAFIWIQFSSLVSLFGSLKRNHRTSGAGFCCQDEAPRGPRTDNALAHLNLFLSVSRWCASSLISWIYLEGETTTFWDLEQSLSLHGWNDPADYLTHSDIHGFDDVNIGKKFN